MNEPNKPDYAEGENFVPANPEAKLSAAPSAFLDKSMNRAQRRAAASVFRKLVRRKEKDPMAMLAVFQAARNKGWVPECQKASTIRRVVPK